MSGPDGSYRIEGLPAAATMSRSCHGSGYSWIEASAPGHAPVLLHLGGLEPVTLGDVHRDLVLGEGMTARGTVVDADTGQPLPDAQVLAHSAEGALKLSRPVGASGDVGWFPRLLQETRTDSLGAFTLPHLPAKGFHPIIPLVRERGVELFGFVVARHPGHAPMLAKLPVQAGGSAIELTLRLPRAGAVEGRVLDSSGAPAPDALVYTNALPHFSVGLDTVNARTDRLGRYRLEGTPVGANAVCVYHHQASARTKVEVWAGETAQAPDLVLGFLPNKKPVGIRVKVRDEGGRPVWGAVVSNPRKDDHWSWRTGEDGSVVFPFRELPSSPRALFVVSRGHAPALTLTTLPADPPPEIEVVLAGARRMRGKVVEADGTPVHGARILVSDPSLETDEIERQARMPRMTSEGTLQVFGRSFSEADGTFVVEDLPEGACNVVAIAGRRRVALTGVPTAAGDLMLAFPLDPRAVVEGSIHDAETGEPLHEFEVWISTDRGCPGRKVAPGRFRIEEVPLGNRRLVAQAPGYLLATLEDLEVGPSGASPAPALRMERGAAVRGVVEGPPGVDLRNAALTFETQFRTRDATTSIAADGTFVMTGLAPRKGVSTWTVAIDTGDAGPPLRVDPPVELRLQPGQREATVRVRVVSAARLEVYSGPQEVPANRYHAQVFDASWNLLMGIGVPGTTNVILSPGRYVVRLTGPDGIPKDRPVVLKPGATESVGFQLR